MYIAINTDSVEKNVFPDGSLDLLITDPPFGINEKSFDKHYNRQEKNVLDGYVEFPADDGRYYEKSNKWIAEAYRVLKDDGSAYIISGWSKSWIIHRILVEQGWNIINKLIWKYNFGVHTTKKYVASHYEIFYISKNKKSAPIFNRFCRFEDTKESYRDRESVWNIKREFQKGTKKNKNKLPSALLEKMVLYSSDEGSVVGDFFSGSFGLKDVCEKHGRVFAGMELNVEAWVDLLGRNAIPEDLKAIDAEIETAFTGEGDYREFRINEYKKRGIDLP